MKDAPPVPCWWCGSKRVSAEIVYKAPGQCHRQMVCRNCGARSSVLKRATCQNGAAALRALWNEGPGVRDAVH